eukprot:Phypoly_transcript_09468.p1 GENE.Phypoly_transcript_09468~~Phypoly_transcript_09468.p1  ORF type:complete len:295 (+),score=27.76 Phypoly_transcript_09468:507-1391(+)
MQANQYINAQGTSYGARNKDYYSPSAAPVTHWGPPASYSQPTPSQYPPNSACPPELPPPNPMYMQQPLYQHPQLCNMAEKRANDPYFPAPQNQAIYQNPPAGPPVVQKVPPIPSPLDQPLLPPGVNVGKKLRFRCNSSMAHPYTGGHAVYDMSGKMVYDVQVSPNSKGREHVVTDMTGQVVLKALVRHSTHVELNILTSQGPKVAVYTRRFIRSGKQIELDGVTYVLTTEKVGHHRIFAPKLYRWAPIGGHEVATRYGNEFLVYNTCPEALELAIVFFMALICHMNDVNDGINP